MIDNLFPVGCSGEEVASEEVCHYCPCHDMFYNYDTANPNYIPNNTCHPRPCPPPPAPYLVHAPTMLRDTWGRFIGFSWYYGQSVTVELGFNPEAVFIYNDGTSGTFLEYLEDKTIEFTIYNFRMEEMAKNIIPPNTDMLRLYIDIDAKLSSKLLKGIYYVRISAYNDDDCLVMVNPSDLLLLVK